MGAEWTEERIGELRKMAKAVVEYVGCGGSTDVFIEAVSTMEDMLSAKAVLSLLDALEEASEGERSKNGELQLASEQLSRCAAELEEARSERDAWREAVSSGRLLLNAVHPQNANLP